VIIVVIACTASWFVLLWLARAREVPCGGGPRGRCMSNLAQIDKAIAMYEIDHPNKWPTSFGELIPTYIGKYPSIFKCPSSRASMGEITNVDVWTSYVLVPLSPDCPKDRAHVFCPPENHQDNGANVVFTDGSVYWFTLKNFEELIRKQELTELRKKHQQRAAWYFSNRGGSKKP